ncbi:transposase IS66, partial [mine drainage metagenome]
CTEKQSVLQDLERCAVGDIFMSLIHTAELAGVDVFDYLVALSRHASDAAERPGQWLPWNYRESLASLSRGPPA